MLDFLPILQATVFILLVWWIIQKYLSTPKNLPPGPWGIPIFGYLLFVGNPPHIKLQEVAKKYGPICSFYFGTRLVILLSDYELIKEAFIKQGDNFAGRPDCVPFRVNPTDNGIATTDGNAFRALKSFIMSTLKNAGGVKESLQIIVRDNAEAFINYLKTTDEKPVDTLEPLGINIAQTYCYLMFGHRYEEDDPKFRKLIDFLYHEQRLYCNGIRIYMKWTRKVPILRWIVGEIEMKTIRKGIKEFMDNVIAINEQDYIEGSTKNFVQAWMTEAIERKKKDPNETLFNNRDHLLHNLNITFAAGYETTTTTLRWSLIFLMLFPEVQEKLRKEIDEVVGTERPPNMNDCERMPYTLATIQEIHRYATIGPLGIVHRNREATTLLGYNIPKSTCILANFLWVHMDPKYFPEPEKFKPERFIDENGKFIKCEQVVNFSLGKRRCPGESLAEVEMFIYIIYLLQNFIIKKPEGEYLPLERSASLSSNPKPFKAVFIRRKNI